MWKRGMGWGVGGVSSIKPKNYTTVLLGGREYLCVFSGSSVSSLYATWAIPAGVATPCGHHLWGMEKNDRCVKKLAYTSVVLEGDICCVWRGWV